MKGNMEERACALAAYIIENRATVRAAAKKFGVSKSTVYQNHLPFPRAASERIGSYYRRRTDYGHIAAQRRGNVGGCRAVPRP